MLLQVGGWLNASGCLRRHAFLKGEAAAPSPRSPLLILASRPPCSGYELGKRVAPEGGGLAADLTAALVAQVGLAVAAAP